MRLNPPVDYQRLLRFGFVGVANTALGYSVILACLAAGLGDYLSNLSGYAVGLTLSFFLNGWWTFDNRTRLDRSTLLKYAATFLVAYAVNLAIVAGARAFGVVDNPVVHLAGIGAYATIFYVGCLKVVYAQAAGPPLADLSPEWQSAVQRHWPELTIVVLWAVAFLLLNNIGVSHDVIWQMWIARQILGGSGLYSQIMEVNPPLWFWTAIPVEWLAQVLAIPARQAIVSATFLLIGASLVILAALVADGKPLERAAILLGGLLALVVIPLPDFAQREHLCLIGAIPYIVLAARRADGSKTSWQVATATVCLAAPAFALKHYFVLAPILLEVWIAWRLKRNWTPFRPETIGLVVGAAIYAAAVLVFAPEFLTTMVPRIAIAYDSFAISWQIVVVRRWIVVWLISALLLYFYRRELPSISIAAAIASFVFCISYFAQAKGWRYHAIPATGAMFFAAAAWLPRQKWAWAEDTRIACLATALVLPLGTSLLLGPYVNERQPFVERLLTDTPPGSTVVMLTGNPTNIWPMVEDRHLRWPSRHFTFWMVYSIFDDEQQGSTRPEIRALADTMRRETVEDFLCNPPDVIIVDDFRASLRPGLDILRIFNESEAFREFFSHYRKDRSLVIYTSYRKEKDFVPERPEGCRQIY